MEEIHIRVSKNDSAKIADLISSLVGIGIVYYTVNPEPFDRVFDFLKGYVNRALHRVSVWQSIQAIRSLPETEKHD